jgi:hypothetical protein
MDRRGSDGETMLQCAELRDLFDDLGREQLWDGEEEKIRAAVLLHDCEREKRMPLQEPGFFHLDHSLRRRLR